MKSIVIGMGIGKLYKDVLTSLGATVYTVDIDPAKAQFTSINQAIQDLKDSEYFETAHICVPNYLHESIASQIAPYSRIVFVEKPGCIDSNAWTNLCFRNSAARFMMVKNNMWRTNIGDIVSAIKSSDRVNLFWTNKNRVPSPGSWFTNKKLSFGGVSRDLIPHLLSFIAAAYPNALDTAEIVGNGKHRLWNLENLVNDSTDYGAVNANGVYNVDDQAFLNLILDNKRFYILADWKNALEDKRKIECISKDELKEFELGLCPEDAYSRMIQDAINHADDDDFWNQQYNIDTWIHDMINEI